MNIPDLIELKKMSKETYELEEGKTYVLFMDALQVNFDLIRKMGPIPGINILFVPTVNLPGNPDAAIAQLFEAVRTKLTKLGGGN